MILELCVHGLKSVSTDDPSNHFPCLYRNALACSTLLRTRPISRVDKGFIKTLACLAITMGIFSHDVPRKPLTYRVESRSSYCDQFHFTLVCLAVSYFEAAATFLAANVEFTLIRFYLWVGDCGRVELWFMGVALRAIIARPVLGLLLFHGVEIQIPAISHII